MASQTHLENEAAEETADVYAWLITIDHAGLSDPIYAVYHEVDPASFDPEDPAANAVTSNGQDYTFYPFEFVRPPKNDDLAAATTLRIENVDRRIVEALRDARQVSADPGTVRAAYIRLDAPDVEEEAYEGYELTQVDYDERVLTGALSVPDLAREPYPAQRFSPQQFPGLA
ncbi:DUF1833 family protein [Hyphobacterium sp.]|uniref:DUF1833 family protein n=1 Tax=Hyphobacterium sp. TaxID=2004662 RepID=UPI003B51A218